MIFAGHDTLWRIVGTCSTTAVGALLHFRSSGLLDREATRRAGAMATALVLLEYLLVLGQTWDLFGPAAEQAGFTITFVAVTGIAAVAFLALGRRDEAAVAARVGLAVRLEERQAP